MQLARQPDRFQFRAGQYVEFILRDGSRRSYSMANAPHTQEDKPGQIELHIRHHARRQVHGSRLRLR